MKASPLCPLLAWNRSRSPFAFPLKTLRRIASLSLPTPPQRYVDCFADVCGILFICASRGFLGFQAPPVDVAHKAVEDAPPLSANHLLLTFSLLPYLFSSSDACFFLNTRNLSEWFSQKTDSKVSSDKNGRLSTEEIFCELESFSSCFSDLNLQLGITSDFKLRGDAELAA